MRTKINDSKQNAVTYFTAMEAIDFLIPKFGYRIVSRR